MHLTLPNPSRYSALLAWFTSRPTLHPFLPLSGVTSRFFSFFYLWLADKSTAAAATMVAADGLHSTSFRSLPTSSLTAMLLFMHCARYAPQHNFLVYFYPPFSFHPYVPQVQGRGETRLCPRQENSGQDERPVSLDAHADVTAAKHVLIICKRSQVGSGVSVHSLVV